MRVRLRLRWATPDFNHDVGMTLDVDPAIAAALVSQNAAEALDPFPTDAGDDSDETETDPDEVANATDAGDATEGPADTTADTTSAATTTPKPNRRRKPADATTLTTPAVDED